MPNLEIAANLGDEVELHQIRKSHCEEWLHDLKEVKKLPAPKKWKEYVFCYGRKNATDLIGSNVTTARSHIRKMRKEMGLTKTNLKGVGNVNHDLVEYILGHVGDSVSQSNDEPDGFIHSVCVTHGWTLTRT